jgi:SWI/SNF-related matrix-associated actin-dependent regulator of chromatin subfamily A member 5
MKKERDSIE